LARTPRRHFTPREKKREPRSQEGNPSRNPKRDKKKGPRSRFGGDGSNPARGKGAGAGVVPEKKKAATLTGTRANQIPLRGKGYSIPKGRVAIKGRNIKGISDTKKKKNRKVTLRRAQKKLPPEKGGGRGGAAGLKGGTPAKTGKDETTGKSGKVTRCG